jgi:hypothetical protein
MKLVVLVPSSRYLNNAGARIRYHRIAPKLAALGTELTLQDIQAFAPETTDADVVIVSKCHDPVSIVAAAILAERGILVGVDLFDDYFSQTGDSRLTRFRTWLDQMLAHCNFVLCSTQAMVEIADRYRPGIAAHLMNDPAPDLRLDDLPQILARKLRQVGERLRISVAWFGVGDNPHFPVGLYDLANFGGMVQELLRSGLEVDLRVLTNRRSLTAQGLELLRNLPVRTAIEEWSEEAETELLASSFVAFLPVSAQPFSRAKSLNRAMTALSSGCQVLSAGYPLYEKLDSLIYRDVALFIDDLARGTMRLSSKRLPVYRRLMNKLASPDGEASRLVEFLAGIERGAPHDGRLVVMHGHSTSGAAHKLVQRVGGLSVASPSCMTGLAFDVVFKATAAGLAMQVSGKAVRRVRPVLGKLVPVSDGPGGSSLEMTDARSTAPSRAAFRSDELPVPFQLAAYRSWMDEMRTRITSAFGPCRFIVSEMSPLPFSLED